MLDCSGPRGGKTVTGLITVTVGGDIGKGVPGWSEISCKGVWLSDIFWEEDGNGSEIFEFAKNRSNSKFDLQ